MTEYRPDVNGEAIPTCIACPWSPRYEELAARLDEMVRERDAMNTQYRRLAAENGKLRKEMETMLAGTELADDAKTVYQHWLETIEDNSRRIKFTTARGKAVQARLNEGWTVDQLKTAIDGAKVGAYVDQRGVKHDGLELICRSADKVRGFTKIADAHQMNLKRQQSDLVQLLIARYGAGCGVKHEVPWSSNVERYPCPACGFDDGPEPVRSVVVDYDGRVAKCIGWCGCGAGELIGFLRGTHTLTRAA